jgi:hypothetical protein
MPPEMTRQQVDRGRIAADDPLAAVSMTAVAREAGLRMTTLPVDQLRPVLTKALTQVGLAYPWGRPGRRQCPARTGRDPGRSLRRSTTRTPTPAPSAASRGNGAPRLGRSRRARAHGN